MKASELHKYLDEILKRRSHAEDDPAVTVLLDSPSLGTRSNTHVKSIHAGFDWEKGLLLLRTHDRISVKKNKEELWDLAFDLIYSLSKEVRYYKSGPKETLLAKRCKEILKQAGLEQTLSKVEK